MKTPLFILAATLLTACGSQTPESKGSGVNALPCKGSLLVGSWHTATYSATMDIHDTCTGRYNQGATTYALTLQRPATDSGSINITLDGNPLTCIFAVNNVYLTLNCGTSPVTFERYP